jgi:DNA mismatch endonuclease (patch repair protein)
MSRVYTDDLTPEQRKHTMTQVHSKGTLPEMRVRRLVHGLGYRYRLHRKDLPGNPDLVFPKRRKIIFVHGCFWHGHDCKAGRKRPKANEEYWTAKLARNRDRDVANQALLRAQGWDVLIVWECDLKRPAELMAVIRGFLGDAGEAQHHA